MRFYSDNRRNSEILDFFLFPEIKFRFPSNKIWMEIQDSGKKSGISDFGFLLYFLKLKFIHNLLDGNFGFRKLRKFQKI